MQRLTNRDYNGYVTLDKSFDLQEALDKLALYEDSGFDPEEIQRSFPELKDISAIRCVIENARLAEEKWLSYELAITNGELVRVTHCQDCYYHDCCNIENHMKVSLSIAGINKDGYCMIGILSKT